MGGNALKNVETRRISKAEYDQIWKEIRETFDKMGVLPDDIHLIDSYHFKADFGDMDILITVKGQVTADWSKDQGVADVLRSIFKSKEVVVNGNCASFEYKGFQIDLISCPYDEFPMSAVYFGYNDLGNLIGKTARNLHLKYGHAGLYHTVRDGIGEKVGEVLVSRAPKEIFKFLDYDWTRWCKGFNTPEDIFEFAISSKYFSVESYALENLNHVDRIRDKKRATYTAFLKWLEDKKITSNFVRPEKRTEMLDFVRESFPDFRYRYDMAWVKVNKQAAMKEKYNGEIVSALTGRKEKELGLFMKTFKESFSSHELFQDFVLFGEIGALDREILRVHKQLT